jgi:hypothetical protein
VAFVGAGFALRSICLAVFDDHEIELITGVYCIRADMHEVEQIRAEFSFAKEQ